MSISFSVLQHCGDSPTVPISPDCGCFCYGLQSAFPWSDWQQRIDVMRVWLATLERTGAIATGFDSVDSGSEGDAWLDKDQEEGLVEILTAQTEAVEGVTQSLANTEHQVERLEGVLRKNRTVPQSGTT